MFAVIAWYLVLTFTKAFELSPTTTNICKTRHSSSRLHYITHTTLHTAATNTNYSITPTSPPDVLCIGETLWDSLPSGMYLGGAPTNVAAHLASLFRASSETDDFSVSPTVAIATCLGKDQLGKEARRRLELKDVRTDYTQFHSEWETGMATAILDENGDATYEFNTPAAWDGLSMEEHLLDLISDGNKSTRVFVMGTIAGRLQDEQGATSSSTLMNVRNNAPDGTVVLDVNLRSPWYTSEGVLKLARGGLDTATSSKKLALLKLNDEELIALEEWCGLESTDGADNMTGLKLKERMAQLANEVNTQRLCVTRGEDGAALWCESSGEDSDTFHENLGYSLTMNNDSDTVGAGDAFLAALINSLFIQKETPDKALERACALGGYVAGCRGATPEHKDAPDAIRQLFHL